MAVEIDQGGGAMQRALASFRLRKAEGGFLVLPDWAVPARRDAGSGGQPRPGDPVHGSGNRAPFEQRQLRPVPDRQDAAIEIGRLERAALSRADAEARKLRNQHGDRNGDRDEAVPRLDPRDMALVLERGEMRIGSANAAPYANRQSAKQNNAMPPPARGERRAKSRQSEASPVIATPCSRARACKPAMLRQFLYSALIAATNVADKPR